MKFNSCYLPFEIVVERGENCYLGYAPEIGGVYEEGETITEVVSNTHKSACAIIETRIEHGDALKYSRNTGGTV